MKPFPEFMSMIKPIPLLATTLIIFLSACDSSKKDTRSSTPAVSNGKMLSELEAADYAKKTTLEFARAVRARNLSLFHKTTADEFQKAFSVAQFQKAFAGFIEQDINLMAAQNYQPVLDDSPTLSEDGTLTVRGYFPTQPSRILFDYSYKWKSPDWVIVGINLDVKSSENPAPM